LRFAMSSPPAESSVDTPTSFLVPNSFLIFRLVFFALLINLSLLQLIFASWNINSSVSLTRSAPSMAILIILGSSMLFFSLALALANLVWSRGKKMPIVLECSGFGIMSLFQIGTAIGTTVTGLGMTCHTSLEWSVCASSLLLVPSTWLSSTLFLAYFLALFMATMAHKQLYSDIWRKGIYEIVWFGQSHNISSKDNDAGPLDGDNSEDIEKSSAQKEPYFISPPIESSPVTPPKASNSVRRGVDAPFRKLIITDSNESPRIVRRMATLPYYPDKSAKSESGSRFIETFRESTTLVRSQSFADFVANKARQDPFPFPLDVDAPIPLPRRSEWVGADALKGIRVQNQTSF